MKDVDGNEVNLGDYVEVMSINEASLDSLG